MPLGQVPEEKSDKERLTLNLDSWVIDTLKKNSLSTSEAARKIFRDHFEKNENVVMTDHQKKNIRDIIREEIENVMEENGQC